FKARPIARSWAGSTRHGRLASPTCAGVRRRHDGWQGEGDATRMGETWRLVRSGHLTGARNMANDEAVIESVAAGGPPTLRFYGWEPAAISLGYFQDFDSEVDEAACQSLGIDIVRRLTGGRAILHDVEVTYSLVISEAHPLIPRSITESYRVISEGLVRGLELLGLEAKMTVPPRRARGSPLGSSPACFDAP